MCWENTFKSSVLPLICKLSRQGVDSLSPFCAIVYPDHINCLQFLIQLKPTNHMTDATPLTRLLLTQLHIFQSNQKINCKKPCKYTGFFSKYTGFVHPFNIIITVHSGEFFNSRIVSSGWKMQDFKRGCLREIVKENQRLFYYHAYLPNFIISPNSTQSHTQQCSLPQFGPVIISASFRFETLNWRNTRKRRVTEITFKMQIQTIIYFSQFQVLFLLLITSN